MGNPAGLPKAPWQFGPGARFSVAVGLPAGDIKRVNALYKLFDRFTEMVPPQILQFIRLGALLIWLIIATIVAYMAWQSGAQSAPQMGQELSLATIREKVEREENLRRTGNVILPDLNDLVPERRRE